MKSWFFDDFFKNHLSFNFDMPRSYSEIWDGKNHGPDTFLQQLHLEAEAIRSTQAAILSPTAVTWG